VGDTNAIETPLVPGAIPLFAAARDSNRVRGGNFSLGLMLTYPRWSVGALAQTPLNADYENGLRLAVSGAPAASAFAEGRLWFPSALGFGAAWRPATNWTVDLDLSWDNWKDAEVEFPATGRLSIFDNLPRDRTATRNTLSINMGAEHVFTAEGFLVPLRFGVAWEPQGARSPYTLDAVTYRLLAVGTGYNTNSLKFDAAFQYRWGKYRSGADFGVTRSTPELPSAVGETNAREWRLKLSLILRVTDTDKLRRTLRKVFGS
jgi:long-subunit fatty acid transport protein